jgi:hypothetical protein
MPQIVEPSPVHVVGNRSGQFHRAVSTAPIPGSRPWRFWSRLRFGPSSGVRPAWSFQPLTVLVVVVGRHVPHLSFLHILLGDEQVLVPEAQLFQRLLAMDQQEAREVVDALLKGRSLVELYDSLFVPTLILIEQDRHKGVLDQTREEFIFLSIDEMIAENQHPRRWIGVLEE